MPIQSSFTFDQTPAPNGASAKTIGNETGTTRGGTIPDIASAALMTAHHQSDLPPDKQGPTLSDGDNEGHGASIGKNAGSIDAVDTHGHSIDTGTDVVHGSGKLKASESGGGGQQPGSGEADEHRSAPVHGSDALDTDLPSTAHGSGHLKASEGGGGNPHSGPSAAGEHSSVHGAGAPDIDLPSTAHVALVSEPTNSPASGDSFHFKDNTADVDGSVANDHAGQYNSPVPLDHHETAAGAHGSEQRKRLIRLCRILFRTMRRAPSLPICITI